MTNIFIKIVNMSISSVLLVLAVLLLRQLLKKAPKWMTVLLWGIVGLRLVCPFSLESALSLIPSAEPISPGIAMNAAPEIDTGIPIVNNVLQPVIGSAFTPEPGASVNPLQIWLPVLAVLWLCGIAVLLAYAAISCLRLRRRLSTAVRLETDVFQSENIVSPFLFGIFRPRIYVPYHMPEQAAAHVIAHERAHIRRMDHVWKALGFIVLALHWFNPFVWLGYALLCRDIELACDEKVIKALDRGQKADYSQTLLTYSAAGGVPSACQLAFGEIAVKSRVKSVLNYRKPAFWVIIAAVIAIIAAAVCFLTDPKTDPKTDPQTDTIKVEAGITYDSAKTNTSHDGIYMTLDSITTDADGNPIFNVTWHNDSSKTAIYGKHHAIEYNDGTEWKDVQVDPLWTFDYRYILYPNSTSSWFLDDSIIFYPDSTSGGLLDADSTPYPDGTGSDFLKAVYSTRNFDISKKGTYRLICEFSVEDELTNSTTQYTSYYTWLEFEV